MTEKCGETEAEFKPFPYLKDVIDLSHKKVTTTRGNSDQAKQAWSRVLISAITAWATLRQDAELEEMKKSIAELKEVVYNKQKSA